MWALVTGGTSGIGLAFATELASRGEDIALVARDPDRLDEVARQLRSRYGVRVEEISADLAVRDDLLRVMARCEDATEPVDILVNNAGFGLNASLLAEDISVQERAFDVMCLAPLALSASAGRGMAARGHGGIINISSASAFIVKGNYSAIKKWVITYSKALSDELAGTGVRVTAVCPAWTKTQFHDRAGVARPKLPSWAWVKPEQTVATALRALETGRVVSIPTLKWKVALTALSYAPSWVSSRISALIRKSRSDHTDG